MLDTGETNGAVVENKSLSLPAPRRRRCSVPSEQLAADCAQAVLDAPNQVPENEEDLLSDGAPIEREMISADSSLQDANDRWFRNTPGSLSNRNGWFRNTPSKEVLEARRQLADAQALVHSHLHRISAILDEV